MKKLNIFLVLTILALVVLTHCSSKKGTGRPDEPVMPAFFYYNKALDFVENNQYDEALTKLDIAISLKPEFAQFHFARGQIFQLLGKDSLSIDAYERALTFRSFYPGAWKSLGQLYMENGRYEKAVYMMENLVRSQPDSLAFEIQLADAYLHADQPLMALQRINYFEKMGGKSGEKLRVEGLSHFRLENYEQAIRNLEKYSEVNPGNFVTQKFLGISYIKTGMLEKGITHLNRALNVKSDDPELYLYRARYFIKLKKYDTAEEQFKLARKLDESNHKLLLEYGKFHLLRGDTVSAEMLLSEAVLLNESCWECFKYLGIIADESAREFEALLYLQKYLSNIYYRDSEMEARLNRLRKSQ